MGPLEPFEVKVPVAAPCAPDIVPEPDWAIAHLRQNASAEDRLKAVLTDLALSRDYAEELKAELALCV